MAAGVDNQGTPRRTPQRIPKAGNPLEVFLIFLRLGLTSFGGPVAHLGYFRTEFVERQKWLSDAAYADLVALCQFLPGPASSQVGIGIGLSRAGLPGSLAAWLGFTTPSALAMAAIGLGAVAFQDNLTQDILKMLMLVAVAVVANAVWGMARMLCTDGTRAAIAVAATVVLLMVPSTSIQLAVIAGGAVLGLVLVKARESEEEDAFEIPVGRGVAVFCLIAFFVLLAGLPVAAIRFPDQALILFDSFYRSGSLVFGGGHVVLPLLQEEVVPPGWVGPDAFLAGYGAAQAMPGPLFTFASYLGAVSQAPPTAWTGALIATIAIFVPSFLLVMGTLPFWDGLRRVGSVRRALAGVNAAVVGLLLAALYDPVITSAVASNADVAAALVLFLLIAVWKAPPWLVVAGAAVYGAGLGFVL